MIFTSLIVLYHYWPLFCKHHARFVWYNLGVVKKYTYWPKKVPGQGKAQPFRPCQGGKYMREVTLMNMTTVIEAKTNKPLASCTDLRKSTFALLDIVREQSAAHVKPVKGRKLYYISAEFLIGKAVQQPY